METITWGSRESCSPTVSEALPCGKYWAELISGSVTWEDRKRRSLVPSPVGDPSVLTRR